MTFVAPRFFLAIATKTCTIASSADHRHTCVLLWGGEGRQKSLKLRSLWLLLLLLLLLLPLLLLFTTTVTSTTTGALLMLLLPLLLLLLLLSCYCCCCCCYCSITSTTTAATTTATTTAAAATASSTTTYSGSHRRRVGARPLQLHPTSWLADQISSLPKQPPHSNTCAFLCTAPDPC